ncbi:unnamed protein product, partial [Rotaria magnacalcarata]
QTTEEQSKADNRHLSIIQYLYLTHRDLNYAHEDYVEQFLLAAKTYLPARLELEVNYQSIDKVTHNFTRDATRISCAKLLSLYVPSEIPIRQQLIDYFPHARIYSLSLM